MSKWESYVRKVVPYVPGEQPKAKGIIKLNTNENPYPPCPGVREALEEMDYGRLRLYPDPTCEDLVNVLAENYGVKNENVFVGVGSDDVISMCFLTFFNSFNQACWSSMFMSGCRLFIAGIFRFFIRHVI